MGDLPPAGDLLLILLFLILIVKLLTFITVYKLKLQFDLLIILLTKVYYNYKIDSHLWGL